MRRLFALTMAGGCAAAVASCGPGPAGDEPRGVDVTTAGTTDTRPVAACPAEQLEATLEPGSPGAGQRYATIVLKNKGPGDCAIDGYGDVRLSNADGTPVLTDSWREPDPAPTQVLLRPGGAAERLLHWTAVPGEGEAGDGPCQPVAARLDVMPPDRAGVVSTPWPFGPVCQHGWLGGGAYTSR